MGGREQKREYVWRHETDWAEDKQKDTQERVCVRERDSESEHISRRKSERQLLSVRKRICWKARPKCERACECDQKRRGD